MSSWPSMTDYQEAIQNPRFCFSDPELQRGIPLLDKLGLPKPITGGFASVYQMNCGGRQVAVRCFLRYHPDQEQRYAAISQYLKQVRLPYMVDFELLKNGIKVRGQWYPILKMEWINGEPLHTYIEQHLDQPDVLHLLADRFYELVADLQRVSIAHGDLQHGNILVVNGDLRLIDYDGMYVPSLQGMTSHEVGHRNYQHPRRSEADFGPHIDNFSAWVIYLSLVTVAVRPSLWQRAKAGDECLLFRQSDFEHFNRSPTLYALELIRDESVQSLIGQLQKFLQSDLAQITSLDGKVTPTTPRAPAVPVQPAVPWWTDYVPGAAAPPEAEAAALAEGSGWVQDHLPAPLRGAPVPAPPPTQAQRFVVGMFRASAFLLLLTGLFGWVPPLTAVLLGGGGTLLLLSYLLVQFSRVPDVHDKRQLLWTTYWLAVQIFWDQRRLDRVKKAKRKINRQEQQEIAALNVDLDELVEEQLAQFPLDHREIRGIGLGLELRLKASGIMTAADVSYYRVAQISGIGHDRAQRLLEWRQYCEDRIKSRLMRQLPAEQVAQRIAIQAKYQQKRQDITTHEVIRKQQLARRRAALADSKRRLETIPDVRFADYVRNFF